MSANEPLEIPIGMRRVCRRFERWRKGHQARLPIPEALWAAAAEAAREHGVFRAAKACTWNTASSNGWRRPTPHQCGRRWRRLRFWN